MTIAEMIAEKERNRAALVQRSKESEDVAELRSINTQIDEVNKDITSLRQLQQDQHEQEQQEQRGQAPRTLAVNEDGEPDQRGEKDNPDLQEKRSKGYDPGKGFESRGHADMKDQKTSPEACAEENGKALREKRSVTVATSSIVLPKQTATDIKGTFLQVSNLVDSVNVLTLDGGESYTQPYEIATAAGDYTGEGVAAANADTTFGSADITKAKITAYSEITEEVEKLPAAPYADRILSNISLSVRKKMASQILIGTGAANTLVGIFSDKATAIDASTDKELAKIDNTTLDDIIYSYGGDEAVEGANVLVLSKVDLAAFAKLRNTDGSKFHDIKPSGNGGSGTIDGTPYLINSACNALSNTKTTAGSYCMAYGNLMNYQLTLFSPLEVKKSTESKFKEGMICHRGVVFAGGNVISHNGFIRIKKAATA